ncbi:heavy metal translocating P-type ATPase [Halorubrum sp. JWXQ-INN 858]|uniref:heavy metal translocating P-type ATPase n=1 Tax=Halorubrum sp. JWXQ-INN 858 TaxID=2690782 RepID=UPI001359737B|nr:cation-translocating P-type ATPase [Halorubrum sp. JWXQ-INN 858]MWV65367.1 heavy metal translocating P-type ATPase [Halorubrum sp. JWXQ-INN 858]
MREDAAGTDPGRTDERGRRRERTAALSVPEMDCPSCAGKIEKGLGRVGGVVEADLRPTTGTATVTYDPGRTTEADVIDAVEGTGYEVTNRGIAPTTTVWASERAIRTGIGAVFLIAGLLLEFVVTGWNPTVFATPLFGLTGADAAFVAAALLSGAPIVRSGYYSARNRSLDIDLLMSTAIVAATAIGLYVEAATLAVLFSTAELLERYAMDRTRDSLRELMELAPNEATVIRAPTNAGEKRDASGDGSDRDDDRVEVTVPVDEVVVGDLVAVRPGEKIPVDGTVREGHSAVDQSPITGESVPVDKSSGDAVYAGTLNEAGYLELEATSDAADSTLSRIIDLVREAQTKRTDKEQFVDRFAGVYTPAVVLLAVLTAALPPLLIDGTATIEVAGYAHAFTGEWRTWFVRGLTLLVIACPCAFVISTPVSVTSGITSAARNGVLVKGGTHLETMGRVNAVAFDKTGTLTKGALTVTDVVPFDDASAADVLRYGGALERRSEHPIADALLRRVGEVGLEAPDPDAFESITGKGVRAEIDGETYYAGKPGLFEELGIDLGDPVAFPDGGIPASMPADERATGTRSEHHETRTGHHSYGDAIAALQGEGKTVILVGTADRLLGLVAIADEVRPAAKRTVANLRDFGVEPVMLTGDNEGTARAVAAQLGIEEFRAELLPDGKVDAIEALKAEYGDVAMIGDGVNDAPALATASVGVAMGAAGTDTAIETADIALMGDDIGKVPYLYALSNRANRVIRQNVWSSLGVKLLLAVGVPFGYVSVAMAVLVGDMGMSLGVTGNAMRLSRVTPEQFLER